MHQLLTDFRQTFISTIGRDTSPVELPRHVVVLDAVLAWSEARPRALSLRTTKTQTDAVSFLRPGGKTVFCTVRVTRSGGATLEICPPTGNALTADDRTKVLATLNGYSRGAPMVTGDRLRIGFGALKNVGARDAVLALMDELLTRETPSTAPTRPLARD